MEKLGFLSKILVFIGKLNIVSFILNIIFVSFANSGIYNKIKKNRVRWKPSISSVGLDKV